MKLQEVGKVVASGVSPLQNFARVPERPFLIVHSYSMLSTIRASRTTYVILGVPYYHQSIVYPQALFQLLRDLGAARRMFEVSRRIYCASWWLVLVTQGIPEFERTPLQSLWLLDETGSLRHKCRMDRDVKMLCRLCWPEGPLWEQAFRSSSSARSCSTARLLDSHPSPKNRAKGQPR